MNGLFEGFQKLIPLGGTSRRALYQGPLGSPIGTLYEAVGEVEVVRNPPTVVEPGKGSRPGSTGRESKRPRSSQLRRKNNGLERSGRGQSPARRSPDRYRTPVRRRSLKRKTTSGKRKSEAHYSSPSEWLLLEATPNTSRAVSIQEPELPARSGLPESPTGSHLAQTPTSRRTSSAQTHVDRTPKEEGAGDSAEEINPSPNVRRVLTRLQHVASPGASSLSGGLDASYKEKATPKKPRPS